MAQHEISKHLWWNSALQMKNQEALLMFPHSVDDSTLHERFISLLRHRRNCQFKKKKKKISLQSGMGNLTTGWGLSRQYYMRALRIRPAMVLRFHHSLSIVFGSQTGTAAMFATQLAEMAHDRKMKVTLKALDEIDPEELLAKQEPLAIVCSVFGEGEPPDSAKKFYHHLLNRTDPACPGPYAVFGLGDSRYAVERFNIIGRRMDERLTQLGKERMRPFFPGDSGKDIEGDFESWSQELMKMLESAPAVKSPTRTEAKKNSDSADEDTDRVIMYDTRPNTVHLYRSEAPIDTGVASADFPFSLTCVSSQSVLPHPQRWNERPCHEVWLEGPTLQYETGDYLGLYPLCHAPVVDRMLSQFKLDESKYFGLKGHVGVLAGRPKSFPNPVNVRTYLSKYCDLHRPLPTGSIRKMLKYVTSAAEQDMIKRALEEKQDFFRSLFWWKSVPDVLAQFPSLDVGLAELVEFLPPSKTTLYSIASSSAVEPRRVRLVVAQQLFSASKGSPWLFGHCSRFLTQDLKPGMLVDAFVKTSLFRPPADSATPVVMVAVGSGIAPFLGFMEERTLQGARNNILYYGCMRPEWDLLCKEKLEKWSASGDLKLNLAFSHVNPEKPVFAQHLMGNDGDELWHLIYHQNAFVYICGHVRLGMGVEEVLRAVVLKGFKGDAEAAKRYYDMLYESGRIKADVFA